MLAGGDHIAMRSDLAGEMPAERHAGGLVHRLQEPVLRHDIAGDDDPLPCVVEWISLSGVAGEENGSVAHVLGLDARHEDRLYGDWLDQRGRFFRTSHDILQAQERPHIYNYWGVVPFRPYDFWRTSPHGYQTVTGRSEQPSGIALADDDEPAERSSDESSATICSPALTGGFDGEPSIPRPDAWVAGQPLRGRMYAQSGRAVTLSHPSRALPPLETVTAPGGIAPPVPSGAPYSEVA